MCSVILGSKKSDCVRCESSWLEPSLSFRYSIKLRPLLKESVALSTRQRDALCGWNGIDNGPF